MRSGINLGGSNYTILGNTANNNDEMGITSHTSDNTIIADNNVNNSTIVIITSFR